MGDTGRIFFSYDHKDSDFALKLYDDLRAAGWDIWIDKRDIPLGGHWDTEVQKALDECRLLLVVLSPASVESKNVMDEVSMAIDDEDKRVMPVLYKECTRPLRLHRLQYLDFTGHYEDALARLLRGEWQPARPTPMKGKRLIGAGVGIGAMSAVAFIAIAKIYGGGDDTDPQLEARFTAAPESGLAPLEVRFSSQLAGSVDGVLWDFGDNESSDELNPVHTYDTEGSYPVTLTARGPNNRSESDTIHIKVEPAQQTLESTTSTAPHGSSGTPETGRLLVFAKRSVEGANADGFRVIVDGVDEGVVGETLDLEPGRRRVCVKKAGGGEIRWSEEKTIRIEAGQQIVKEILLYSVGSINTPGEKCPTS